MRSTRILNRIDSFVLIIILVVVYSGTRTVSVRIEWLHMWSKDVVTCSEEDLVSIKHNNLTSTVEIFTKGGLNFLQRIKVFNQVALEQIRSEVIKLRNNAPWQDVFSETKLGTVGGYKDDFFRQLDSFRQVRTVFLRWEFGEDNPKSKWTSLQRPVKPTHSRILPFHRERSNL